MFIPASGVQLIATGSHLPSRVVTNEELVAKGAPLSSDEMVRLCGIKARRYVDPGEATSDLAIGAGREILRRAGVEATTVDRLVLATISPDHSSPSAACFVQHGLGLRPVPAFDVAASCSGFLFALDVAARAVLTGESCVMALAADVRSRFLNPADRATAALFGDGAAGALLAPCEKGRGLLGLHLATDGAGAHSVYVPAGGSREPASAATVSGNRHTITMSSGPEVYLAAADGMLEMGNALLSRLGLTLADVDLVVPHQANKRLLDRVSRIGGIPPSKMVYAIEDVGNMSAASCPYALDQALVSGRAQVGMKVLLVTAGAGHTAGAALLEIGPEVVAAARRA